MAAITFFQALKRDKFRVLPGLTVAGLVAGQPKVLVDQVWEPLCIAALNTPIAEASARIFVNVLRTALDAERAASDFLIPRVDLERLFPEPAGQFIRTRQGQIRSGEPVISVTATGAGYRLGLRAGSERFDEVICAVAPQHFTRLTAELPTLLPLRSAINRFAYQPIATVYLEACGVPALSEPVWQLDGAPGQWLFDRGALCGKPGLYAVVVSAAALARAMPQEALAAEVMAQLRRVWPDWPPARWTKVIMEKRATFACTPGMVRPEAGRVMEGFYLAGDYTDPEFPGTIEAAVRTGVRAAQALLAQAR